MSYHVAIFSKDGDPDTGLLRALEEEGVTFALVTEVEHVTKEYQAAVIDLSISPQRDVHPLGQRCQELAIPLLCALPSRHLARYDHSWGATDFIVLPARVGEVSARIRQATRQSMGQANEKTLEVGDLRIDLERYEVFNRGRRVLLTFKEYQLLCLLASNPGRVFSREILLNQIWEYDYFGGTRSVDVHIRRLRSKVEDPGQAYIETVWNVGYRFRDQPPKGG
ncbi:MAG: response regulator transcription factor [Chloroflexi bacterium]|nr:response regulator transcription factor [Chloroflexota bacterium]